MRNRVHFIRFSWGKKSTLLAKVAAGLVSSFLSFSILEFLSYTDYWLQ
jgi:hypothetical protein